MPICDGQAPILDVSLRGGLATPVLHPVVTFARHRRDGRGLGRRVRLVPERDVPAADVHELWHCVDVLQAVARFLHGSSHHTAKF
jgi:hypothetical protein